MFVLQNNILKYGNVKVDKIGFNCFTVVFFVT